MNRIVPEIVPKEGEVFYAEINLNHPFAITNVSELLNSLCGCEAGWKECRDGEKRNFFTIPPHAFSALLRNPAYREGQYVLWHTTPKTLLSVRYKFEKPTLEDIIAKGKPKGKVRSGT